MRVLLEGYPPPSDPRLSHFLITPDPGVIEVNIQPAPSWDELVEQTTTLYEEAHQARPDRPRSSCSTAATPARAAAITSCSAARRRRQPVPAAARSAAQPGRLLAQPSVAVVSVLGTLHRADEPGAARRRGAPRQRLRARARLLASFPRAGSATAPPWLVDRALRHLLVDVTGNTHRAEFCIDKLYSPDTRVRPARPARDARVRDAAARADEPRAAAAAARAGRALLAASRTTTPLDALGHGAARSLHAAVLRLARLRGRLEELRRSGYAVRADWFAPHFEFRFPLAGELCGARRIQLTLRQALEPWHVLGEEGAAAARRATSIRRSNDCRCTSPA